LLYIRYQDDITPPRKAPIRSYKMKSLTKKDIQDIKKLRKASDDIKKILKDLKDFDSITTGEMIHAPAGIKEIIKMIMTTNLYK
jgi:hypothetical protein